MKAIVALAICLGIAIPSLCQSTSASKDQQEKEQQLRTALEQIRNAIDRYHGMFIRGKIMAQAGSQGYPTTSRPWSREQQMGTVRPFIS